MTPSQSTSDKFKWLDSALKEILRKANGEDFGIGCLYEEFLLVVFGWMPVAFPCPYLIDGVSAIGIKLHWIFWLSSCNSLLRSR